MPAWPCRGTPPPEDDLDQAHARKVLDREHYGLQKVKERILELLAVRKLNQDVKGRSSALSALRASAKRALRTPLPSAWTANLPA